MKRVYYTMTGWINVDTDDDDEAREQFEELCMDDKLMTDNLLRESAEIDHVEEE